MRPTTKTLAFALAALVLFGGVALAGETDLGTSEYLLIKDLPFIDEKGDLSSYLYGLFQLMLGIAVTAAVFMLVVHGIQYMLSDVPAVKSVAKTKISSIIGGLVLAFASVIILNTINPNIVKFDLLRSLDEAAGLAGEHVADNQPAPDEGDDDGTGPTADDCKTCVPIPTTLPVATRCGGQCKLEPSLIPKLEALNTRLKEKGIGWAITEAWPPIYKHKDSCHVSKGTCVDANFRGTTASAENIVLFQEAARASGLSPLYEVTNNAEAIRLKAAGVNPIYYNPNASAPHFHIK